MDIFAHTLWAAAGAKGANKNKRFVEKNKKSLNPWWAGFWGVMPDFFAFGFPFLSAIYFMVLGKLDISSFGSHHGFGFPESAKWIGELPPKLYNISHSLIVFLFVFLLVWLIRYWRAKKNGIGSGRPYYEMLGWALHILIDIPSHANGFFLTPFLWPISDYRFTHGVSWANLTYMVINYTLLITIWTMIIVNNFKRKKNLQI